jgi:hypothetical protein
LNRQIAPFAVALLLRSFSVCIEHILSHTLGLRRTHSLARTLGLRRIHPLSHAHTNNGVLSCAHRENSKRNKAGSKQKARMKPSSRRECLPSTRSSTSGTIRPPARHRGASDLEIHNTRTRIRTVPVFPPHPSPPIPPPPQHLLPEVQLALPDCLLNLVICHFLYVPFFLHHYGM